MYIGIGTIVVIVIIVLVILMLRRRLCFAAAPTRFTARIPSPCETIHRLRRGLGESLTEPGDCQARFSLGGEGREVPRSVAVERSRVQAG